MKLSEKQTGWIIVKADVKSEWDSCDFVIVELNPSYIDVLKRRVELARLIAVYEDLYLLTFWDSPVGWYRISYDDDGMTGDEVATEEEEMAGDEEMTANDKDAEIEEIIDKLTKGPTRWSFVEFDDESEIERFVAPEQRMDLMQMEVYMDGLARFIAAGKNTDEIFWTAEFSIDELVIP